MGYANVLQHSEEDCGAASLAAIAKHHGRTFTLARTREAVGTGQLGTTLLGLRRGAESLGFQARSATISTDILDRVDHLPLPAILHWQGKHWVVFHGKKGKRYVIADPAIGIRFLSQAELLDAWNDQVILLLRPDPVQFYAQHEEPLQGLEKMLLRLRPYRTLLTEAFLCVNLIGLLSLASPFLIQLLTDDVLIRGDTQLLGGVLAAVVLMSAIRSGLSLVSDNLITHFAQRLELSLTLEFGLQILQLPLTYYETRRSGEVVSRLHDIEDINSLVSQAVISLPSGVFIALVSFVVMLVYSWRLTLVAAVLAAAMLLSTLILQPIVEQQTRRAMVLEAQTQGVLVETFKGALTLKTIAAAPQLWDEIQSRFSRLSVLLLKAEQINIFNSTFSYLVGDLSSTAILGLGSLLVINQSLSIGQLLAFTSLSRNVTRLMDMLVEFVDDYIRAKTANQRLQEVVAATPENPKEDKKPWVNIPRDTDIVLTDINFHYPGRTSVFRNFSLSLEGGQAIALIGRSGCGKSTLAKIIAKLYPIQSGTVHLDNLNLHDLATGCVRQQIVLIPQEAHFWSRSILENFRLGNPRLTFEQIVDSCKVTGADDFVSRLPEGYQTVLGEFGCNLSGGQRQRLAIARALAQEPAVLILDESTAGLDPISEAELLDKLLWHRQDQTTLLISHRPQVIRLADDIVFLEESTLKLQGNLEDLQRIDGDHLDFLAT
ncbi:MAG: peptidase domain-containing ABC transporter [Cyanobacteria bacterium P01_F01_bin.3]